MEFYIEKVNCNMKSFFPQNVFKRPKRLKMDTLYSFREKNIHFFSLKLYKVSIFNPFGRLNSFCRKELFMLQFTFSM